jgi:hypothetical protein
VVLAAARWNERPLCLGEWLYLPDLLARLKEGE